MECLCFDEQNSYLEYPSLDPPSDHSPAQKVGKSLTVQGPEKGVTTDSGLLQAGNGWSSFYILACPHDSRSVFCAPPWAPITCT